MQLHAVPTHTSIAAGILFGVLGFAVNWLNPSLFFGVNIFFGSFFVMIALLRFGTGAGVLAATLAASYSMLYWQTPLGVMVWVGEALAVGLMLRRSRNVVLLDTLFWFCLGMPMFLLYQVLTQTELSLAILLTLKHGINGIFNALSAALLLHLANLSQPFRPPGEEPPRFHHVLSTFMVAAILIPGVCYVVLDIRRDINQEEQRVTQRLHSTTNLTRQTIETWLAEKTSDVKTLASLVGDPQTVPASTIQKQADLMKLVSPHFVKMSVQNSRAVSVAFVPAVDEQGRSNVGRDYSAMPYHRIVRKTLKPAVSDVDYGTVTKGPRLALFAPIVIGGQFHGYCTGVVEISRLAEQLRIISENRAVDITLLDRKRQIIASTDSSLRMMERLESGTKKERRPMAEGVYQLIPRTDGLNDLQRWHQASFGMDSPLNADVPWSIVINAPMKPFLATLEQNASRGFALVLVLIIFSIATAQVASAAFTRPIARLEEISASLPLGLIRHQEAQWPHSGIREVAGLVGNVRQMASTLQSHVHELQVLNESLEKRVDERTNELYRSEQKFRAIFTEAGVGILLSDRNRLIIDCNPAMEKIFGYSHQELIGKEIAKLSHPDDGPFNIESARQSTSRQENVYRMEKRFIRKDGSLLWGRLTITFIKLASGSAGFTIGMVEDITPQRELQAALRESEAMYRSLVETAPYAMTVTNIDGSILMANHQSLAVYGENRIGEIIGRSLFEWVAPSDHARCLELLAQVINGEMLRSILIRLRRSDGSEFIGEVSAMRLPTIEGVTDRLIMISADVTAREEAASEIRRLNEVLEARVAERTAELKEALRHMESFSYSISHDLRAPLRAVNGYAHILLEDFGPALPAEAQRHLNQIAGNGARMAALIDDLLTFSRLSRHPLTRESVDTIAVVRDVLEELERERQGRTVQVTVGALSPCQADPSLIRQVFSNLLSNALKYTRKREDARIEVGSFRKDGATVYFVRDNGDGFDMAYADKLFGVFQRLHRSEDFEGTGVGLAIVHNIVTRHGGTVWAESEPGNGATFFFTIAEGEGG